mmetsp:Transcript_53182/g.108497  ORF Transcript_53182/g.108497 Transcript_53182/m.108497 type:complete len:282 (+) Transcript_53182:1079-1924(+)
MHAYDVLRTRRDGCHVLDGKGGGVGRDDHVLPANRLHVLDNLVLHAEVFEHGFDNHVTVLEVSLPEGILVGETNEARHRHVLVERRHLLLLHLLVKARNDVLLANLQTLRVEILQRHRQALGHRHLGNPSAHQSGTEHANLLHGLGVLERVLLQRRHPEEKRLEPSRLRGEREVGEAVSLEVIALRGSMLVAFGVLLDNLEDFEGRGVVSARGLHHLGRRLLEHVVACEIVLLDSLLNVLVHALKLSTLWYLHRTISNLPGCEKRRRLELVRVSGQVDKLG